MTENVRTGLGMLAVAAMALIVGIGADVELIRGIAGLCALIGLGVLAWDLLRPQRDHTKSSSGDRSSGDT